MAHCIFELIPMSTGTTFFHLILPKLSGHLRGMLRKQNQQELSTQFTRLWKLSFLYLASHIFTFSVKIIVSSIKGDVMTTAINYTCAIALNGSALPESSLAGTRQCKKKMYKKESLCFSILLWKQMASSEKTHGPSYIIHRLVCQNSMPGTPWWQMKTIPLDSAYTCLSTTSHNHYPLSDSVVFLPLPTP